VLIGVIGLLFIGMAAFLSTTSLEYILKGERVQATIVDRIRRMERERNSNRMHEVNTPVVSFTAGGRRYKAEVMQRYYDAAKIRIGARLAVYYLPGRTGKVLPAAPIGRLAVYTLFFAVGLTLLLWSIFAPKGSNEPAAVSGADDIDGVVDRVGEGQHAATLTLADTTAGWIRLLLWLVSLVLFAVAVMYPYAAWDQTADKWRPLVAGLFFGSFALGTLLFAVRKYKTVLDPVAGRVELHKGFFVATRKGAWPLSQFTGVSMEMDGYHKKSLDRTFTYSLTLERPNGDPLYLRSGLKRPAAEWCMRRVAELTGLPPDIR